MTTSGCFPQMLKVSTEQQGISRGDNSWCFFKLQNTWNHHTATATTKELLWGLCHVFWVHMWQGHLPYLVGAAEDNSLDGGQFVNLTIIISVLDAHQGLSGCKVKVNIAHVQRFAAIFPSLPGWCGVGLMLSYTGGDYRRQLLPGEVVQGLLRRRGSGRLCFRWGLSLRSKPLLLLLFQDLLHFPLQDPPLFGTQVLLSVWLVCPLRMTGWLWNLSHRVKTKAPWSYLH